MNYSTTFQTFKQTAYQPIQLPNENRNYSIVDKRKVDFFSSVTLRAKYKHIHNRQITYIIKNKNKD